VLVRFHMSSRVATVGPKDTLETARHQLDSHGVRQLPVVHEGLLVGIITDRDLRSAEPEAHLVEEVMTQNPITIESSGSVDEAARILRQSKVNSLPVVDEDQLVGMLSTSDVLDAFVALSGVAEPSYRLVLDAAGGADADERLRAVLARARAEVLWMQRGSGRHRSHVHVRVRTTMVGDVTTALEAAGFTVLATIVSPGNAAGPDIALG